MSNSNDEIRTLLEQANVYAAGKQWGNAAAVYCKVLDTLYADEDGWTVQKPTLGLKKALEQAFSDAALPPKGDHSITWPTLPLTDAKAKTFKTLGAALKIPPRATHVSAFQWGNQWTIAFHAQVTLTKASAAVQGDPPSYPANPSVSYILDFGDPKIKKDTLRTKPTSPRIAYTLAHYGESSVNTAINLYKSYQILLEEGVPAILEEVENLLHSIVLDPSHGWTWARLGDTYRNIANGWPGFVEGFALPEMRMRDYARALLYLHHAIDLYGPDHSEAFWAHAHFAAAVVNVRAFVGRPKNATGEPADLDKLFKPWCACADPTKHTAKALPICMLDRALTSLVQAQQSRGFYYPWAQAYHAAASLIKSALLPSTSMRADIALFSTTQLATAYYYDPALLETVVEPGELQVNPHFEAAVIFTQSEQWYLAWQFAHIGMYYRFKYHFLPGLDGFTGCYILAFVSHQIIASGQSVVDPENDVLAGTRLSIAQDPIFPIPNDPIDNTHALYAFIDGAYDTFCAPAVAPYLKPHIPLNTTVAVGLHSALQLLVELVHLFPAKSAHPVKVKLLLAIAQIGAKLGLKGQAEAQLKADGNAFSVFAVGKPTYHFVTQVQKALK